MGNSRHEVTPAGNAYFIQTLKEVCKSIACCSCQTTNELCKYLADVIYGFTHSGCPAIIHHIHSTQEISYTFARYGVKDNLRIRIISCPTCSSLSHEEQLKQFKMRLSMGILLAIVNTDTFNNWMLLADASDDGMYLEKILRAQYSDQIIMLYDTISSITLFKDL